MRSAVESRRWLEWSTAFFLGWISLATPVGVSAAEPAAATPAASAPAVAVPPAALSAAQVLPGSAIFYAELQSPDRLLESALAHPFVQQILALPQTQKALQTPDLERLRAAVKEFERRYGESWQHAASDLSSGGIYFAIEPVTQGGIVMLRGRDPDRLAKLEATLLDMARTEAENRGEEMPFEEIEYRGLIAHKRKEAVLAVCGPWLLVTNKLGLGKMVVDRILDGGSGSLAEDELFQRAMTTRPAAAQGYAFLRLDVLRLIGALSKLTQNKHDNPAAELFVGGLAAIAEHAPYITASFSASKSGLTLQVEAPFAADKVSPPRQFFFAPAGAPSAPALVEPNEMLLSISGYRDFARFWLQAEQLFDESIVAKFTKADSDLSLYFSGKDFSTEILGKIGPRFQVVVARQSFVGAEATPTIKLPTGAIVLELLPEAKLATPLKIAFQNIVGLGNLGLSQQGLPQLELSSERVAGGSLTSTRYLVPEEATDEAKQSIVYNFSPSLAVTDRYIVFSSTESLARSLLEQLSTAAASPSADNTRIEVRARPIFAVLQDNLEPLVSNNMLEKGHSREEAEGEVGILLAGIKLLDRMTLRLAPADGRLVLEISLQPAE